MSTYCYTTHDGSITEEHFFPLGKAPATITTEGGSVASRDFAAEWGGGQKSGDAWVDHCSLSLMVNPDEARSYEKDSVEMGVPTKFNVNGMPEFTSSSHKKKYCKAYGFVDFATFY